MNKDEEVESVEHAWKGGQEQKKQETRNETGVMLWRTLSPGGRGKDSFVHISVSLLHCKLLG